MYRLGWALGLPNKDDSSWSSLRWIRTRRRAAIPEELWMTVYCIYTSTNKLGEGVLLRRPIHKRRNRLHYILILILFSLLFGCDYRCCLHMCVFIQIFFYTYRGCIEIFQYVFALRDPFIERSGLLFSCHRDISAIIAYRHAIGVNARRQNVCS